MSDDSWDIRKDVERIRKVSDMLCTAHADLRDRYSRRALLLDLCILGISTWLIAVVFVDPQLNISLTPLGLDPRLWIGFLSVSVFLFSLVQLKADWKKLSDSHQISFSIYSEVKHECGALLCSGEEISKQGYQTVLARYRIASDLGTNIPEKEFLRQKQSHKIKVAISQHLDNYPAASLRLLKIKYWFRDNFGRKNSRKQ